MKKSPKKRNPDGKSYSPRQITLSEVKKWMVRYIKDNPDYDPRDMANHAIIHLNIQEVTPKVKKVIQDLAYETADEFEMNR